MVPSRASLGGNWPPAAEFDFRVNGDGHGHEDCCSDALPPTWALRPKVGRLGAGDKYKRLGRAREALPTGCLPFSPFLPGYAFVGLLRLVYITQPVVVRSTWSQVQNDCSCSMVQIGPLVAKLQQVTGLCGWRGVASKLLSLLSKILHVYLAGILIPPIPWPMTLSPTTEAIRVMSCEKKPFC